MDKALKQRLVGASVLVALAVVVLPMLLSGQPEGQQESRSIELPVKPPDLAFETRRFPIGDQDSEQPSEVPSEAQASSASQDADRSAPAPAADSLSDTSGGSPVPAAREPAPAADAAAEDATPATASTGPADPAASVRGAGSGEGRYLVQVASFSSVSNANRLAGLLRDNAMPVLMDTVQTPAGRLHRVRIGPFDERAAAERAIATLGAQMPDLSPRLLDQTPEEAAPVTDPSDPLVRWVVQVGSFADVDNAENLVYRLRDAGFRASSAAVTDASGTSYRVRVGPVIERDEALRIAGSIEDRLGLEGLVMSAD